MTNVIVVGAGIGGLTTAALLAQDGYRVTVLEAQTYPGGSASTFYHKGYRFDSGATLAGGFQPNGPHAIVGEKLGLEWNVHADEPAWVVHMPGHEVTLTSDYADILHNFPASSSFWEQQAEIADLGWSLSAQGLPWPPTDTAELLQIAKVGLGNLPQDLKIIPFALMSTRQWMALQGVAKDPVFKRFIDGQLLISAQTTADHAYALYSATALDLARQGVYHAEGGIGGIAEQLVEYIRAASGHVEYRRRVSGIKVKNDKVIGVYAKKGRHASQPDFFEADFVVANLTPWNLEALLEDDTPRALQKENANRNKGYGAFVVHMGLKAEALPEDFPTHHQFLMDIHGNLGEGRSLFLSIAPEWDTTRAPAGMRAATMTTHTRVDQWWQLLESDETAYYNRKDAYARTMIANANRYIPGFKQAIGMMLPGSPVTYEFYTGRHLGMVGGFPARSLFNVRGPRTGIENMRLVGDSIFPGQSTAGVSLGAIRVAEDIRRRLPTQRRSYHIQHSPRLT